MAIGFEDIKVRYVEIAEARKMSGLRIVLGAYPIPGPWREACKGVFWVKGLKYTAVRSGDAGTSDLALGMGGSQSELIAWTGQASAPVVAWNDERPRSSWIDQLNLAERLAPSPSLVPASVDDRVTMFGLANELLGENGMVWVKRLLMVDGPLKTLPADDPQRAFWTFLGDKYGYSPAAAEAAALRIRDIVSAVAAQLARQQAAGKRYLVGDRLSAVDIYWATCCAILDPLPPEKCPMAEGFRGAYGNTDPRIEAALTPALRAHRDFIYETHLEFPIVF
ncbi:MAG: glutathione S-transferase C-terminal domain-containing protein [Gammaproteobacteria bacterium]